MTKRGVIFTVIAVLLDYLIFDMLGIARYAPHCLFALIVVFSMLAGFIPTAIISAIAGFIIDTISSTNVGLTSITFVIAAVSGGIFHGKFYADNVLIPAGVSLLGIIICEGLTYIYCLISGRRITGFSTIFLTHILPCAILTAAVAMLCYSLLSPAYKKKEKY